MEQTIIAKIGEYNQLSFRISSLDQKQAKGGIPQRESVSIKKAVFVIGACFVKPPIITIFWLLSGKYPTIASIEWIMDPDPKNNNAFE